MNKPYLSIISCTKNSDRYIERNIKTVEKQDFINFEHIPIDGESTNKTIDIINIKGGLPGK